MEWLCELGHTWKASIQQRALLDTGCAVCANWQFCPGFNDLKTKYPEIAAEADGWDPSKKICSSRERLAFKCSKGHKWATKLSTRISGAGCPSCAQNGFTPTKQAWFYLMERKGEQQLGISNSIKKRLLKHHQNGWLLIEKVGPADGHLVYETEYLLRQWLKTTIGTVERTFENWYKKDLEVRSLAELKQCSGIETELF